MDYSTVQENTFFFAVVRARKGRKSCRASQSCLKPSLHIKCMLLWAHGNSQDTHQAQETWPLPFLTLFHYLPVHLCFRVVCSLYRYANLSAFKCSGCKLTRRAKEAGPILSVALASHRNEHSPATFGWVWLRHSGFLSDMI